ncbi:MAG: hypothetical protein J2P37_12835, partial [Ktedonobacteraceae bacterium]|nr:hypothetical protein [Ktedonobacteraceae bacterium]
MTVFRGIRPLCWFVSLWIGFTTWNYLVYYWEHAPTHPDITALAFVLLTVLHLGIYWYSFTFSQKRNLRWPLLLIQVLLALVL